MKNAKTNRSEATNEVPDNSKLPHLKFNKSGVYINAYFAEIVAGEPSPSVKNLRLVSAASEGNLTDAFEMLKRGANPIAHNYRALRGAVRNNEDEIIGHLLNAINDPEAKSIALKIIESKRAERAL